MQYGTNPIEPMTTLGKSKRIISVPGLYCLFTHHRSIIGPMNLSINKDVIPTVNTRSEEKLNNILSNTSLSPSEWQEIIFGLELGN